MWWFCLLEKSVFLFVIQYQILLLLFTYIFMKGVKIVDKKRPIIYYKRKGGKMSKKNIVLTLALLLVFAVSLGGCSQVAIAPEVGNNSNNKDIKAGEGEHKNEQEEITKGDQKGTTSNPSDDKNSGDSMKEKLESVVFISVTKLNVRDKNTTEGKIIGGVMKGKAVKVIEEVKDEAGESDWYKIEFENAESNNQGWISAKYTVKDRIDLLGEEYRELDFSPQNKVVGDYPGNPRVEVKGIYLTIHSAANALGRLDKLIQLAKDTDINTFVIDVKDDHGNMLFETEAANKFDTGANKNAPIKDIEAFMKKLKENNIYTIARIVSFKDPKYAARYPEAAITRKSNGQPYTKRDGIIWVSAHDRKLWEYNIEVSKEAAKAGFNEIQFDYVRFPVSNGGKLDKLVDYKNELNESKQVTIQKYLKYAYKELSPLNVYIAADIFGQVGSVTDDMDIGQYWEAVSNVVDYVSPMMYPSHYGNGVYGLSVPDAYPYETIDRGIKDALERNKNIETPGIIRPWIQDFTASWVKGYIKYDVEEVKAQIKALEDNGVNEYILWNAANRYTEDALK